MAGRGREDGDDERRANAEREPSAGRRWRTSAEEVNWRGVKVGADGPCVRSTARRASEGRPPTRRRRLASACTRSARGRLVSSTKLTARPGMVGDLPERRAVIGRRLRDAPLFRKALWRMATRPRGAASLLTRPRADGLALAHQAPRSHAPRVALPPDKVASAPRPPNHPPARGTSTDGLRPRLRRRPVRRARHPRAGARSVARRAAVARAAPMVRAAAAEAVETASIGDTFAALKKDGQCAFVPFIARAIPTSTPPRRRSRSSTTPAPTSSSSASPTPIPSPTVPPSRYDEPPIYRRDRAVDPRAPYPHFRRAPGRAPRGASLRDLGANQRAPPSREPSLTRLPLPFPFPPIVRPLRLPRRARSKPARPSRR